MEFNFNKIKSLMQGEDNRPLPPELDWSKMKDGILGKMESIEKEEPSEEKNKYTRRGIGWFLILLFALTVGLFSVVQNMGKDQDPEAANDVFQLSEADIDKSASNNINKPTPINRVDDSKETSEEMNGKIKENDALLIDDVSASNQAPKKPESGQVGRDQLSEYQHLNENDPPSIFQGADRVEVSPNTLGATQSMTEVAQNATSPLAEIELPNSTPQTPETQAFPIGVIDKIGLVTINDSNRDLPNLDSAFRLGVASDKSPNQLILEGGFTFWTEGYGSNEPERAQYETPIASFQLQGYYTRSLRGNFFIMAGLQYQQLESRLRYNKTLQDYTITLKDTIVQVENDLTTGSQRVIRGDVEQTVQAERRVQHYNKTKLFKVSLGAGKTWRFNSFQTDVYFGGALNSLVNNQGRIFYDESIIDYDGASNSLFQNQWTVDGIVGARLHYFLNQNMALTTGFNAQKSLMNWSNKDGINFYPASFSLQLGMSYSW